MTTKIHTLHNLSAGGLSRRNFIRLAAAAGLMAACNPMEQPAATSPDQDAPANAAAAPTAIATAPPLPSRADLMKIYPNGPSKVVHTHHQGVWQGDRLSPKAIRHMLDASITRLTGLNDAREAWAALFNPTEKVAIKVNTFRNSLIWTHAPLVLAVTDSLQAAGLPPEQIVIFDYYTDELQTAGYPVNKDGPGVRCYGTEDSYSAHQDDYYVAGWTVEAAGTKVKLSHILMDCDALINMPVLKSHMITGTTFALKNHYGSISSPESLHYPVESAMAGLNALPPIKDRTRLIIGDILTACLKHTASFPYWKPDWTGDSILMSFDPIAHDTVGLQWFSQLVTAAGGNPEARAALSNSWLATGAELGLGANDLAQIKLEEITLT